MPVLPSYRNQSIDNTDNQSIDNTGIRWFKLQYIGTYGSSI